MTDIIDTPVKRVIPEGWHLLRDAIEREGDLIEHQGRWKDLDHNGVPLSTDADGMLWGHALVIRRNAPVEPSVEDLKARVATLEEDLSNASHDGNQWRDTYSATITEVRRLEGVVKNLQDEHHRNIQDLNRTSCHNSDLAIEASNLRVKVAELEKAVTQAADRLDASCKDRETLCKTLDAKDAEIEELRKERDLYKDWHLTLCNKVAAVKKAWEGA